MLFTYQPSAQSELSQAQLFPASNSKSSCGLNFVTTVVFVASRLMYAGAETDFEVAAG